MIGAIEPGQRFGWLTVLGAASPDPATGKPRWLCGCGCGRQATPRADHLKAGRALSCGCRRRRRLQTFRHGHGLSYPHEDEAP